MKKVLVYQNRKIDPMIWDISTPELRLKALLALFNMLEKWGYYNDIQSDLADQLELQKRLYEMANEGNPSAAEELLTLRRAWSYDYERWDELKVQA